MESPPRSNALVYVVLIVFVLGALVFFYLLFGELFVVALAVALAVGTIGGLHYFLWGRGLTESSKKEAKAHLDAE